MDRLKSNFITDSYYMPEPGHQPLQLAGSLSARPSIFGMSVQTKESNSSGYVNQESTRQSISSLICPLNKFSVTPLTSSDVALEVEEAKGYDLPEITQEVLDKFVPITEPSSCPVDLANPFPDQAPQQGQFEDVQLTEGFGSGESQTITLVEAYNEGYQKAYHQAFHKAYQAEMNLSGDHFKATKVGQVVGRAVGKFADRVQRASPKQTEGFGYGKSLIITPVAAHNWACSKAYYRAYQRAYRDELNLSGNPVRAREAGRTEGQAEKARFKQTRPSSSDEWLAISPREAYKYALIKAYRTAYSHAYHMAYKAEMHLSGDPFKAKKAAQTAGKAAGRAGKAQLEKRV